MTVEGPLVLERCLWLPLMCAQIRYEPLNPRQIVPDDGFGILHLGGVASPHFYVSAKPWILILDSAEDSSGDRPARALVRFFPTIAHSERFPGRGDRGDVFQQSIRRPPFFR